MKPLLAGLVALAVAVPASADLAEGNWRLSQHGTPISDARVCLLKVEKKDGKLTATVIALPEIRVPQPVPAKDRKMTVEQFKADGDMVHLVLDTGVSKVTFDGTVDARDKKVVRGAVEIGPRLTPASLTAQEGDKLQPTTANELPRAPEPFLMATKLANAPLSFQLRAQRSQDANEKAELLAQAKAARAEADAKLPALYRETVEKHADNPYAVLAANRLLPTAAKTKASSKDVAAWTKLIEDDAARYGDRIARDRAMTVAEILVGQKGYEATALAAANKGAEGLSEKTPPAAQSRALRTLKAAQLAAGKEQEAKATDARLAKVEAVLDAEYAKTVPPFQPEKFAGRKNKAANRVVVMELFTGAQCPPCVAADVAFDALETAYDSKDLVLIQYHMHIPGPDPLTNPDTIARWDYYRGRFAENVRGTPTTLFNGKPFEEYDKDQTHRGGGAMANAKNKFGQYRAIIDPLLEQKGAVTVTGSAKRTADKVHVAVAVDGVKDPGDKVRLRLLVVEEKVKYVGGNGLRFHHKVVRAMPGGAAGTPVTDKSQQKSMEVDLGEVKKGLTRYLDGYAAERPFANPDRPMDLAHLTVIALVQDDATGEILNAAEFEVAGK